MFDQRVKQEEIFEMTAKPVIDRSDIVFIFINFPIIYKPIFINDFILYITLPLTRNLVVKCAFGQCLGWLQRDHICLRPDRHREDLHHHWGCGALQRPRHYSTHAFVPI